MKKEEISSKLKIFFAILGWIFFIYSVYDARNILSEYFSYFTIQSNILVLLWLSVSIFCDKKCWINHPLLKGGILVYITATMIVFFAILMGQAVGLNIITSYGLHLVMPLGYILIWFLEKPSKKISFADSLLWLIYPIVYLTFSMIRGNIVGWYPYFFLSPIKVGSWVAVDKYIGFLTLFFVLLVTVVYWVNNKRVK